MKRSAVRPLACFVAVLALLSAPVQAGDEKGDRRSILYFNDLGSGWDSTADGLANFARLAGVVKRIREENRRLGVPTLVLASGDVFSGGSLAFLFRGEAEVEALNALGVDAMVPGDHFLEFGERQVVRLRDKSRFPLLASNLLLPSLQVNPMEPYLTRAWDGKQIAIIGFASRNVLGRKSDIAVTDPLAEAQKLLPRIRPRVDLVIGLSHLDFITNLALAERAKGLDVLIGGLSLPRSEAPKGVGRCLVSQSHGPGLTLSRLDFEIRKDRFEHAVGQVIVIAPDDPVDSSLVAVLEGYWKAAKEAGKERVAEGIKKLPALGPSEIPWETDLGNLVADAVRERLGTSLALVNSSAIRAGLPFGPVTVSDVFRAISPQPRLASLELKGTTLAEILEISVSGKCRDFLQISGLTAQVAFGRVTALSAGQDAIVPDRWYLVATTDSTVAGTCYSQFKRGRDYMDYDLSLAQVVLDYLREKKTIGLDTEVRIRVKEK